MATKQAEAVYNPSNLNMSDLPRIYGFNNGGSAGFYYGQLISEDGTALGSHLCSSEGFMWGDLGILEGTRPDRHEHFRQHHPGGYRMEFISYSHVKGHAGLALALKRNAEIAAAAATNTPAKLTPAEPSAIADEYLIAEVGHG